MTRILDLENSSNWVEAFSNSTTAIVINSKIHIPISEIIVPFPIGQYVLGVYINTIIPDGSSWKFGGYLNQHIPLGISFDGVSDANSFSKYKLSIGKIKLIIFPKLTSSYTISISVPKWFKNADLIIWKYTGIDLDSTDELIKNLSLNE